MAFLEELELLPADQAQARMRLFYGHLRTDWRSLFAELRDQRPVLDLPLFSVVSRWTDVMDTLSRPSDFQVTYRPHMDPSVGPFMLARDDLELNWHDKSLMRALLRWDDLPAIRSMVARLPPRLSFQMVILLTLSPLSLAPYSTARRTTEFRISRPGRREHVAMVQSDTGRHVSQPDLRSCCVRR